MYDGVCELGLNLKQVNQVCKRGLAITNKRENKDIFKKDTSYEWITGENNIWLNENEKAYNGWHSWKKIYKMG